MFYGLQGRGAKLTQRDLRELNEASEALALAANIIKRDKPRCMDLVVDQLIKANNVIVRVHDKGAGVFARYLEKKMKQKELARVQIEGAANESANDYVADSSSKEA